MDRKPNELHIAAETVASLLAAGSTHAYTVEDGPIRGAQLLGVRFEDGEVVLEYDRPVNDVRAVNSWSSVVFASVTARTP